ncbi:DMT family transporter [Microbacterium capsulatum]|uniref:DMT family transporter n=1 Tax=Microbacterium capsulatum TaxID=3041921 RepID=A0ABU0XJM2_9MICO|nr:DMT family transporter [Microbacterium sp. ASV81]MDQ4215323.1 DMT family transporter [Microbacterium sp. ASV81]
MTTGVLLAVLGSAIMHGTWNAIAKAIPDRLVASTLIGLVYLAAGGIGAILLPLPHPAAWPALVASVLLQTAYLIMLTEAYAHTDFGVAYPLTRGLAVLGVTVLAVALLGERLTVLQTAGVAIVIGALFALAFARRRRTPRRGLLLALAVGACVTAYSFVDGIGVRASHAPLGYAAWLFLLQGLTIPVACLVLSRDRRGHLAGIRRHARLGTVGGVLSLVAYTIVVWAQSIAPLALVSALRETGVIAAGLIGLVFFREKPGAIGIAATVAAAVGIVAIRLGA